MKEHTTHQVKVSSTSLGTMIVRFELDPKLVDEINKLYEEHKENLEPWNDNLAGKIADEKRVEHILTNEHKGVFLGCFKKYLEMILKPNWVCIPENAWINDMYAGEYNPLHFHSSPMTDLGLSSVFVLKRPSTYGKEFAREGDPTNGWLQFTGGDQSPLSSSQFSTDAMPGHFYVFPYSLLHGVYPFNGTKEVRRTMSYNCNLFKESAVKYSDKGS